VPRSGRSDPCNARVTWHRPDLLANAEVPTGHGFEHDVRPFGVGGEDEETQQVQILGEIWADGNFLSL